MKVTGEGRRPWWLTACFSQTTCVHTIPLSRLHVQHMTSNAAYNAKSASLTLSRWTTFLFGTKSTGVAACLQDSFGSCPAVRASRGLKSLMPVRLRQGHRVMLSKRACTCVAAGKWRMSNKKPCLPLPTFPRPKDTFSSLRGQKKNRLPDSNRRLSALNRKESPKTDTLTTRSSQLMLVTAVVV